MVVSILLFALFIFVCTSVLFFMFCFFIPALASVFNGGGVGLLANTGNILPEEEKYSDVVYTTTLQAHIEQPETDTERLHFRGVQNCAIFQAAYDSHENGVQRCIGYGDCMRACPQGAIFHNGKALVVSDLCTGCGRCVGACPVSLISLVPSAAADKKIPKKHFKFWYACYKMFAGLGRG